MYISTLQWKQNLKSRRKEIISRNFGCEFKSQCLQNACNREIITTEVSAVTHMVTNAIILTMYFIIISNLESDTRDNGFGYAY